LLKFVISVMSGHCEHSCRVPKKPDYVTTLSIIIIIIIIIILLQLSCHSVAVVLTLVQTKRIRINIHKRNNTKTQYTIQNTVNTSTHITKIPTQLWKYPHTLQNKLKQPQYKIHTKWNSHNTVKYPQCKVTIMYMIL
jgi:hypothetical protein